MRVRIDTHDMIIFMNVSGNNVFSHHHYLLLQEVVLV